jgi:hypothetical protein
VTSAFESWQVFYHINLYVKLPPIADYVIIVCMLSPYAACLCCLQCLPYLHNRSPYTVINWSTFNVELTVYYSVPSATFALPSALPGSSTASTFALASALAFALVLTASSTASDTDQSCLTQKKAQKY